MKKLLLVFSLPVFFCNSVYAQIAPSIEWEKCFGGSDGDRGYSIQQTTDGDFILAGYSRSENGDVTGKHAGADYWIVKVDPYGSIVWQKALGGSEEDQANSIQQTTDGGYIVAGFSDSDDGDAPGNLGGKDYWIVKLDAPGNLLWQKRFGGMNTDEAYSIAQTTDGGCVIAGYSNSTSGDVSGNHGGFDYWVVNLDGNGNLVWQKTLGGTQNDDAYSIQQTMDGGFIIAGITFSGDYDVSNNHGKEDYWIVKLDGNGNISWQKSIGGSKDDEARSVRQTTDGGFVVAGNSCSNDGDAAGNNGGCRCWIVKLDANGSITWQKFLDGDCAEGDIQQTADNGFIIAGGDKDYFIARLDVSGNLVWQEFLGGNTSDAAHSIQQITDGGFIVLGESNSHNGDVSGNYGQHDYWVVKLSGDLTGISSPSAHLITLSPNPVQSQLTINFAAPVNEIAIRVYDLQGRIQNCVPSTRDRIDDFGLRNSIELNTENLPPGFYTIQIISGNSAVSEVAKFVKE